MPIHLYKTFNCIMFNIRLLYNLLLSRSLLFIYFNAILYQQDKFHIIFKFRKDLEEFFFGVLINAF